MKGGREGGRKAERKEGTCRREGKGEKRREEREGGKMKEGRNRWERKREGGILNWKLHSEEVSTKVKAPAPNTREGGKK